MNLIDIFKEQYAQQQLWHDWPNMSAAERAQLGKELLLHLHEEVAKLQRISDQSRYHLLKHDQIHDVSNIADAGIDVFKLLVALMCLNGVDAERFSAAWETVTARVTSKWRWQREQMDDVEVLLCDIDGVIAEYTDTFRQYVAKRMGRDVEGHINTPDMEPIKDEFHSQGGFRECPPIPGAIDTLNQWRATWAHRRLVLVTARPFRRYRRIYSDTVWWCGQHRLAFDHILFEHDKAEAVRQVQPARIVAHIEDRGKHALEVASTGVTVYKLPFAAPEERVEHRNIFHVKDWGEIRPHLDFNPEGKLL